MIQTYDTILLLAGENKLFPRSEKAIEIFKHGTAGSIFLTGGYGGFADREKEDSGGKVSAEYLLKHGVPEEKLYIDNRSLDTLGNFTYPTADPIPDNPDLIKDLDKILLVTERGHMPRALQYANKVLPENKFDHVSAQGPYTPNLILITKIYNASMLRALKYIKEPDPDAAHAFLLAEHPFYKPGWFDKPIRQRQLELGLKCAQWYLFG